MFNNVLVIATALLIFITPIIGIASFSVRGYNTVKQQQDLNPMPFVFIYSVVGLLISAFIVSIFLTLSLFITGANLQYNVCSLFAGGEKSFCEKYKR